MAQRPIRCDNNNKNGEITYTINVNSQECLYICGTYRESDMIVMVIKIRLLNIDAWDFKSDICLVIIQSCYSAPCEALIHFSKNDLYVNHASWNKKTLLFNSLKTDFCNTQYFCKVTKYVWMKNKNISMFNPFLLFLGWTSIHLLAAFIAYPGIFYIHKTLRKQHESEDKINNFTIVSLTLLLCLPEWTIYQSSKGTDVSICSDRVTIAGKSFFPKLKPNPHSFKRSKRRKINSTFENVTCT